MRLFKIFSLFVFFVVLFNTSNSFGVNNTSTNKNITIVGNSTTGCLGSSIELLLTDTLSNVIIEWYKDGIQQNGITTRSNFVNNSGIYTARVIKAATNDTIVYLPVSLVFYPKPIANYTYTQSGNCFNSIYNFNNTSVGSNLSYEWDFGDPNSGFSNSSSLQNPSHKFVGNNNIGTQTFAVRLITTNSDGCKDTFENQIVINNTIDVGLLGPNPINFNGFQYFTECASMPSLISFVNNSSTTSTNTNYRIIWGDGSPDFISSTFAGALNHTYQVGTFNLLFIVTSNSGCVDTGIYKIFVGSNPAVGLGNPGNTSICNGNSLTFPITSFANNPPGTLYTVTFSDGTPPTIFQHPPPSQVTHVFDTGSCGQSIQNYTNAFSASIVASNPCGSSQASISPIYISEDPISKFIASDTAVCVSKAIRFTNISPITNNVNLGTCTPSKNYWKISPATGWQLISGTLGSNNTFPNSPSFWLNGSIIINVNFNTPGIYKVVQYVGNPNCGLDSSVKTICVNPQPIANFSMSSDTICQGSNLNLTNLSNTPSCLVNRYTWSITYDNTNCSGSTSSYTFSNSTNANSVNPQIRFNNPGKYIITLTNFGAFNNNCLPSTYTKTIIVKSKPRGTINPVSACVGSVINFSSNINQCYTFEPITYNWSFPSSNISSSSAVNPSGIIYNSQGNYIVSLIVSNTCGADTAFYNITVSPKPTVNQITDKQVCNGITLGAISITSNTPGATFTWTNSDNTIGLASSGSGSSIPSFVAVNNTSLDKYAQIIVTPMSNGCIGIPDTFMIRVFPSPVVSDVVDTVVCSGTQTNLVVLKGSTVPGTTYTWTNNTPSIGLASSGSNSIPSFVAVNNGSVPITATITITPIANGCQGVAQTYTITVNPRPTVNFSRADEVICSNTLMSGVGLTSSTPGVLVSWDVVVPAGISGLNIVSGTGNIPSQTIVNNTDTTIVIEFKTRATTTGSASCTGIERSYFVTVRPTPRVNATRDTTICRGTVLGGFSLGGSNVIGTIYTWTNDNTSIGLAGSGTGSIPSFTAINNGQQPVVAKVIVTPMINGCPGVKDTFEIVVNPSPSVTFSRVNEVVCSNTSMSSVVISSLTSGANITWDVNSPAGITGLNVLSGTNTIPSQVLINTTSAPITITFSARASTSGLQLCSGVISTYTVTVNPTPTINTNTDQQVCSGSATQSIVFTGTGTSYRWTNSDPTIGLGASGIGNINSFIASNNSVGIKVATIIVTPEFTNSNVTCSGKPDTILITINPRVQISNANSLSVCSHQLFQYTPVFGVAGVTYSWSRATVPGIQNNSATGVGSISETLINTTNASVVVRYVYTMIANGCTYTQNVDVTVSPKPTVNQINNLNVCHGEVVNSISFQSNINGVNYIWLNSNSSIGLFNQGVGALPTFTATNVTNSNILSVISVVAQYNSCYSDTIVFNIVVKPELNLTNNNLINICSSDSVLFNPIVNTTIDSILWFRNAVLGVTPNSNLGKGSISERLVNNTNNKIQVKYIYVIYSDQCSYNDTLDVVVNPLPLSRINVIDTIACAPINITSLVSSAQVFPDRNNNYQWYINGVISTTGIIPPNYSINNPGDSISLMLITSNQLLCKKDTSIIKLKTFKPINANFEVSDSVGCGPLNVSFTNKSSYSEYQSFKWDFDNGTMFSGANPATISFPSNLNGRDTIYTVKLLAYNQCDTDTFITNIRVKATARSLYALDKSVGCSPFFVKINNLSTGNNNYYILDYGDGNKDTLFNNIQIQHTYFTSITDTFYLKLLSINECGIDSQIFDVIVFPNSINANLTINATNLTGCAPHTIEFYNTSLGSNIHIYDFGDSSGLYLSNKRIDTVIHTYNLPGIYKMKMRALNNCSDTTVEREIIVYEKPIADFILSDTINCIGELIGLVNVSSIADSYHWNFGDGKESFLREPSHIYHSAGLYNISLVVTQFNTNGLFCRDTFQMKIRIVDVPLPEIAEVIDSEYCGEFLANLSSVNKGQFQTYWHTGDSINNIDYVQFGNNFSHHYKTPGIYKLKLFFVNKYSCIDSTEYRIHIKHKPIAQYNFINNQVCDSSIHVFTNKSIYLGPNSIRYIWKVNGQTIEDSVNLTYKFISNTQNDSDLVVIQLNVIESSGCEDSILNKFYIRKRPIIDIDIDNSSSCVPFYPTIINKSKFIDNYFWYVNDTLKSLEIAPDLSFLDGNKTYKVKLVVSNYSECYKDSLEISFNTYPTIKALIQLSDSVSCNGQLLLSLVNNTVNSISNKFDFGDGVIQNFNGTSLNYFYQTPGEYRFVYFAENSFGCKDTFSTIIKIANRLKAEFIVDKNVSCESTTINFNNTSIGALNYFWDFDDGTYSIETNPSHYFQARDSAYNVKLISMSKYGCADTFNYSQLIKIHYLPIVEIGVDDSVKVLPDRQFYFHSASNFEPISQRWDFGDNTFSYNNDPQHIYKYTGSYLVKLYQVDSNGCENFDSLWVRLDDIKGKLWVPNAFTPNSGSDKIRQFLPIGYGIEFYDLKIYNLHGQLLFESNELDEYGVPIKPWDGTLNGQEQPQGVYVWKINARFKNGNIWKGMTDRDGNLTNVGTLTLIR